MIFNICIGKKETVATLLPTVTLFPLITAVSLSQTYFNSYVILFDKNIKYKKYLGLSNCRRLRNKNQSCLLDLKCPCYCDCFHYQVPILKPLQYHNLI